MLRFEVDKGCNNYSNFSESFSLVPGNTPFCKRGNGVWLCEARLLSHLSSVDAQLAVGMLLQHSLVPRPHPAFHHFQYGKAGIGPSAPTHN